MQKFFCDICNNEITTGSQGASFDRILKESGLKLGKKAGFVKEHADLCENCTNAAVKALSERKAMSATLSE